MNIFRQLWYRLCATEEQYLPEQIRQWYQTDDGCPLPRLKLPAIKPMKAEPNRRAMLSNLRRVK